MLLFGELEQHSSLICKQAVEGVREGEINILLGSLTGHVHVHVDDYPIKWACSYCKNARVESRGTLKSWRSRDFINQNLLNYPAVYATCGKSDFENEKCCCWCRLVECQMGERKRRNLRIFRLMTRSNYVAKMFIQFSLCSPLFDAAFTLEITHNSSSVDGLEKLIRSTASNVFRGMKSWKTFDYQFSIRVDNDFRHS